MSDQTTYPLSWPAGWPRVKFPRGSKFGRHSMNMATWHVQHEVSLLGATSLTISTNVQLRLDGLPYSNQRAPQDAGAAIYFKLKSRPVSLACDKWNRVECNLYAIAKHIEALRGQERWGIGTVEQAFTGYMQLPAPMVLKPWYQVLGLREDCTFEQAQTRYRRLAMDNHPDRGGSVQHMVEINTAWNDAKISRGWK